MKRLLEIEGFGVIPSLGRLKIALIQVSLGLSHSHQCARKKVEGVEKSKPNLEL
jgi:hypothetical protein